MASIPYVVTVNSLTFYLGGTPYTVDRNASQFNLVVEELKGNQDAETLKGLVDASKYISQQLEAAVAAQPADATYLTKGVIKVTRTGVTFNGEPLENALTERLMDIAGLGLPVAPWVKFAENLYQNPSEHAREELYLWLEAADLPITDDGYFIAYKIVSADFKDLHTRSFDNSPGQIVELAHRSDVDDRRNVTCSRGLHFCSKGYLPKFGNARNGGDDKVILVKVNPADVVSIPSDYANAKGRTWRYEVLEEISYDEALNREWAPIRNTPVPVQEVDFDDDVDEDVEYDDLVDTVSWQDAYDEASAELNEKGITTLRSLAAAYRAGDAQWIWKSASKYGLVDYIATRRANAAIA